MLNIFKRKEPVSNAWLVERYEASLNSKDETIERLLREKGDLELRLFQVRGELIQAKAKLDRILAPLKAANEARRGKKRETV